VDLDYDDPGFEEEDDQPESKASTPSFHDYDYMSRLSKPFKFTMNVQLALIVFLAAFW
jgi:hypothetical protein